MIIRKDTFILFDIRMKANSFLLLFTHVSFLLLGDSLSVL